MSGRSGAIADRRPGLGPAGRKDGFIHLVKDGHTSQDASAGNHALINALRNGGDLLNVFGDFPTPGTPTPTARCGTPVIRR
jgi:hypothetical protein